MPIINEQLAENGSLLATNAKRISAEAIQPKPFNNVAGSPTYLKYSPVAFNTSTGNWVIWASGGANGAGTIKGFLAEDVTVDADDGEEVLANVILKGRIHIGDVTVPAGQTLDNLKIAMRSGLRELGFIIQGLDDFR